MCCIVKKVLFLTFYLFQMPYTSSLYVYINNLKNKFLPYYLSFWLGFITFAAIYLPFCDGFEINKSILKDIKR